MLFSTTTQYAIRGLTQLAARPRPFDKLRAGPFDKLRAGTGDSGKAGSADIPARPTVMLDELVAGTDLPREFLAKVFQQLVKAGILSSVKGRGGGFALSRPSHEISLLQIVSAIDGPSECDRCVVGLKECRDDLPCPQHDLFKPIRQRLKDYLQTTTLADMVASLKSKGAGREKPK